MIVGWFGEVTGRPYVLGRLAIPRLGLVADIFLCVDTGSDRTTLMPADCRALGIDRVAGPQTVPFSGVGGDIDVPIESAWVAFEDGERLSAFEIGMPLVSIQPEAKLRPLPSLLGRDVLHRLRIDYQFSAGRLQLEVESSDLSTERNSPIRPPVKWLD